MWVSVCVCWYGHWDISRTKCMTLSTDENRQQYTKAKNGGDGEWKSVHMQNSGIFRKKSTNRAAHSTRFIHIIGRLKCSWIEHLEFLIAYFAYEIEKHWISFFVGYLHFVISTKRFQKESTESNGNAILKSIEHWKCQKRFHRNENVGIIFIRKGFLNQPHHK